MCEGRVAEIDDFSELRRAGRWGPQYPPAMTSRPGAAEGRRPWWRAALVTVPALALVAALIGLVGPLTGDHGGGPGPNGGGAPAPVAARTASPAAAASTGAGPAAPVAPAPAALTAATAAGPPAGGPGAGAVDVRRSASAAAAPAVDPVDPARPPQTWAVIVGINRYPRGDHDLRTAAADARDVDDALDGYGVASDHRLLLLDRQATAPNIRAALGWLAARAGPQDTAVVFFAGHAAHIGGRRGVRPEVALIAADDLAVPESQMAGLLAPLRARSVWLALAACYGAEFDGLLAPGRLLTAAAGRGQLAYENDALPHSYLVEYMVQRAMIEGDAGRSVEDSFD